MNIEKYLNEAEENYSGFYGYEEESDFMPSDLDFDGDELFEDDYEEASSAVGLQTANSPSPYQLNIVNSTAGTLNTIIFGKNRWLLSANYGSATGITITPSQTNVTYLEVLQQSAEQPFETSLIRVQSTNTAQVTQIMELTSKDANGQQVTLPLITQSYFSANQFQAGIIDIPYSLRVDGNMYITYPILANTTAVITFFPKDKVNVSRALGNKNALKAYAPPSVAIGIPTVALRRSRTARRALKK